MAERLTTEQVGEMILDSALWLSKVEQGVARRLLESVQQVEKHLLNGSMTPASEKLAVLFVLQFYSQHPHLSDVS